VGVKVAGIAEVVVRGREEEKNGSNGRNAGANCL